MIQEIIRKKSIGQRQNKGSEIRGKAKTPKETAKATKAKLEATVDPERSKLEIMLVCEL